MCGTERSRRGGPLFLGTVCLVARTSGASPPSHITLSSLPGLPVGSVQSSSGSGSDLLHGLSEVTHRRHSPPRPWSSSPVWNSSTSFPETSVRPRPPLRHVSSRSPSRPDHTDHGLGRSRTYGALRPTRGGNRRSGVLGAPSTTSSKNLDPSTSTPKVVDTSKVLPVAQGRAPTGASSDAVRRAEGRETLP